MADNISQSQSEQIRKNMQLQHIRTQVPAASRKAIAGAALSSQIVNKQKSYYSTVRFQFAVAGAGPYTYTLAKGTRVIAFSYGINDAPATAGFDASFGNATEADTNLLTKGDTGGATVKIYGLALYLGELSDAHLAKQVWANTFVDVTLNGSDRYALLGRMGRIPGAGGLVGLGESRISTPDVRNTWSRAHSMMTNGNPDAANYLRLAEPLNWLPVGGADSRFQIRFETARAITETVAARAAIDADGIAAFAPPTVLGAIGTYVDVVTYLHAMEFMPRSKQQ